MLLAAEIIAADEMQALGLLNALVDPAELDAAADALVQRLLANAPLTLRVSKEAIRRIALAGQPDIRDLIATVYGSADFAEGVRSFLAKDKPVWQGR
jgi:enoyl-CoA hydratase/carnithine racemase